MADHRQWICTVCRETFSHDDPVIVFDGRRFHSEACFRAWDRFWGRLAVVVWIAAIIFILAIALVPL